jgi:hypothetical protein
MEPDFLRPSIELPQLYHSVRSRNRLCVKTGNGLTYLTGTEPVPVLTWPSVFPAPGHSHPVYIVRAAG